MSQVDDHATPVLTETKAGAEEKAKLKISVGRMDGLVLMICALVGLDTVAQTASYGAQSIVWLLFMAVFFFVPYAMLCSELGTAFPYEGGPYVWVKLSFGRVWAGIATLFYWITNPVWVGGTLCITAVATFSLFFTNLTGVWKYIFALLFIWIATLATVFSFRVGKWIPTLGAYARAILIGFFSITVLIYAAKHGLHGFGAGSYKPTWATFLLLTPILFFNFEGFELPSEASEEMKDAKKDVPFNILRGGIGTVFMYGLPIIAILVVLPVNQVSNLSGFIDAIKTVFTVYGGSVAHDGTATLTGVGKLLGDVAAIGFILALISSATSWLMGANRGFAVAGMDGAAPRFFGKISEKYGTPVAVDLLGGVISSVVMFLAFWLTSGNNSKYFSAVLGITISATTLSYCIIFPALIKLRYKYPNVDRPYKVPGGTSGVWIVGLLATFWAALASIVLLWPGLLNPLAGSSMDSSLPSTFTGERFNYEASQLIPLAIFLGFAIIFYLMGVPTRKEQLLDGTGLGETISTS